MPKGRFAQLTSWSYSVYTQYVKCPFSVCLDKILRVRIEEPDNPHFAKGNWAHDIAERFVSGVGRKPPLSANVVLPGDKEPTRLSVESISAKLEELRGMKPRTEQELAFDRKWNQVDWRDWKTAWLRMKMDVCADSTEPPAVEIIDWKTGKVHQEHRQQRPADGQKAR